MCNLARAAEEACRSAGAEGAAATGRQRETEVVTRSLGKYTHPTIVDLKASDGGVESESCCEGGQQALLTWSGAARG